MSLRCCLFLTTMQRYDDFWLIPRKIPDSYRSCCDRLGVLRQNRVIRLNCVVQSILLWFSLPPMKNGIRCLWTRRLTRKPRRGAAGALSSRLSEAHGEISGDSSTTLGRLTGIAPDETIGIPSDQPARWMAVGMAMAIQENGTDSLDYFAMLRGWGMCRNDRLLSKS